MRTDVTIIGGSFAGLSAATYLARGRRSVAIIDAGKPRNRFASASHGFLTHDGGDPRAMLARSREQVGAYPTVRFVEGSAVAASRSADGFGVRLASGDVIESRLLVLAFGISDELPDVPGLAERWGSSVIHCPYCHGYEFGGQRLGVLSGGERSVHQALLVSEWGPTTLYLNGGPAPDTRALEELGARGIAIEPAPVLALRGKGRSLEQLELGDGRAVDIDALYVAPRTRMNSDIATQLGCGTEDLPSGPILVADATRQTSVPGVFAAGDVTRGAHAIAWAVADGVMAGVAAHRALVFPAA